MDTKELRDEISRLPEIEPDGNPWTDHRISMRKHIMEDDLDDFLSWSTVRATMYTGWNSWVKDQYKQLPRNLRKNAVLSGKHGGDKVPGSDNDAHMIQQLFHLHTAGLTEKIWNYRSVFEVGGGVGAMCTVVYRMGFTGSYTIIDHPEMLMLQRHFINAQIPHHAGMIFFLTPEDFLKFDPMPQYPDLLLGIASLSEMPLDERDRYLVDMRPAEALLYYQPSFPINGEELSNVDYFGNLVDRQAGEYGTYEARVIDSIPTAWKYLHLQRQVSKAIRRAREIADNGGNDNE